MHRALGTRSAVCRAEHSLVLHCSNTGGTGARRHLPREALAAMCQAESQVLGCGGLCARLCTRRPLRPRRAPGVRARGAGCGRARGRALRGRRHAARRRLLRRAARPGGLWRGRGSAPGRARRLAGRQARPAAPGSALRRATECGQPQAACARGKVACRSVMCRSCPPVPRCGPLPPCAAQT